MSIAGGTGRSIITPLLITCGTLVGVTLITIALGASLLSLWFGYGELSRRGDSATAAIARALNAEPGRSAALDGLDVDTDILAATVVDASGQSFEYSRKTSPPSDAVRRGLRDGGPDWGWEAVVAQRSLPSREGARVTIAYDTYPAKRRALLQLINYAVGALLASLAVTAALRFVFLHQMRPMRELASATVQVADGRYDISIAGLERRDEIGLMARAIEGFKSRLIDRERLREQAEIENRLSSERHIRTDERVDDFRSTIRRSLHEVGDLSDQMQVAADSLASIATQTTSRAESAVTAIRQTSANVSTVAEASEDLSASIREIERQVEQTRSIVSAATRSTAATSSVIKGLFAKSEQIDEIIGLIQAIAAQTNLLSLNATIEAARAGESGRGFAVVAQEVKSLANQTARASHHVADHVRSIQTATSQAVEAIETIDATMAQAEQFSAVIAVAVERQAAATTAISRNAADAAKAAGEAADTMKRLAAAIGETDQSAAQVHQSATDVGLQARDLSTTIDAFLADTASLRDARDPALAA